MPGSREGSTFVAWIDDLVEHAGSDLSISLSLSLSYSISLTLLQFSLCSLSHLSQHASLNYSLQSWDQQSNSQKKMIPMDIRSQTDANSNFSGKIDYELPDDADEENGRHDGDDLLLDMTQTLS